MEITNERDSVVVGLTAGIALPKWEQNGRLSLATGLEHIIFFSKWTLIPPSGVWKSLLEIKSIKGFIAWIDPLNSSTFDIQKNLVQ